MNGEDTSINHLIEYLRLSLIQNENQAIDAWFKVFAQTYAASLLPQCQQLLQGIKSSHHQLSLRGRALILHAQALFEVRWGDSAKARRDYQRGLTLFQQINDLYGAARILNDLGTLHYEQGWWLEAVDAYQSALDHLLKRSPTPEDEAMTHNNLGLALLGLGQTDEGLSHLEQAREIYDQLGHQQNAARVQINLGQYYHQSGDIPHALTVYESALEIAQEFNNQVLEIDVHSHLATLYRYQGRLDEAYSHNTECLRIAQDLNDLASQALALGNLGATFQLQNKLSQALTAYEQALALYEMLDDRQGQAQMWANLGHLSSLEKSSIQALTYQQKSLVMYREIGDLAGEAKAMINVANAHRDLKQFDEAEKPLQAALDLSQKLGSIRLQDSAIGALGTLRMAQNRLDEAQALLQEALALQKKRGDTHAQVETIYKLGRAAYEQEHYNRILDILTPGWELALENDYGRWLFDMALLLGHAARDQLDPGGINYYAVAVGLACQYESERHLRDGLEVLVDLFVSALERGKRAEALEVCQYLIEYWLQESWQQWTAVAVNYIEGVASRIEQNQPIKFVPEAINLTRTAETTTIDECGS